MDSSNFYHDHNKYNLQSAMRNESSSGLLEGEILEDQTESEDKKESKRQSTDQDNGLEENYKLLTKHAQMQGFDIENVQDPKLQQ